MNTDSTTAESRQGRPCSPPAAEAVAKAQFQADREEWLAQRRAGGGIQATVVTATGGFAGNFFFACLAVYNDLRLDVGYHFDLLQQYINIMHA